ncbi:MAG TPA: hypothetical protein VGQ51_03630 [Puia sp.]|nr:hypothetical protein [Puia sp.]
MRIFLCLCLSMGALSVCSQDLDYPDFRQKKDNFSKIHEQDIRADVASFALAAVDESIGKPQLPSLPVVDYGSNFMKYANDNIQVIIRTGFFLPAKHKLMVQEGHLLRIDGKPYYGGVYGQNPHTTIESITVVVGTDTVPIPSTAYFDLYDPKFSFRENGATRSRNGVFLSGDKHTFYIYMLNIDNKGTEYTWVIRDKQYLRRVVDFGFLEN